MSDNNTKIDFVIAWVDGSDENWKKERDQYRPNTDEIKCDDREERYRDWDNLKYWFRGVERFAFWVHKIYFVTWGHLPEWLNTDNPKLEVIKHKDYIPDEFLPTFNSHTIELNFHRIVGLSEQFVYFNDDMFLMKPSKPEDFFVNGQPKDMLALQPVVANESDHVMPYIYLNNGMVLAKYFNKRENVRKQPGAYFHVGYPAMYFFYNLLEQAFPRFTGFYTVHGPSPMKKSTYDIIWEKEHEYLTEVCRHKFRCSGDVNQYLIREWQKLSGCFFPANVNKKCRYFDLGNENGRLLRTIERQLAACVCINDANVEIDCESVKNGLCRSFEQIFPEKSSFEK